MYLVLKFLLIFLILFYKVLYNKIKKLYAF